MAKQNTKAAANDLRSLFDPQGYQNVFKTWAGFNERLTGIMVEAATKSTDIATGTAHEAFDNIREVTQVRDEPTGYAKAYSDFAQKQMELFTRTAQSFGDVTQKAGSDTSELASKTGEELSDKVASNASDAADKANSAADKAGNAAKNAA